MINLCYTGVPSDPSGYGDANRTDICSLFVAGVNITVEPLKQMVENTNFGIEDSICSSLIKRDLDYKIKILHVTPDLYPQYKEEGVYHVGRLFWETDRLPEAWIKPCNEVEEIWTASPQMALTIKESGVKTKIYTFPEAINVQRGYENIVPFRLKEEENYVFYSIFQWIDRKNPRGLLRSYWKAFEGNENVVLLLKTYRTSYLPTEFDLIKKDIQDWKKEMNLTHYPRIFLVKKLLTTKEITKLHKMGNCFINPSSGEGWCRPMQEAMLFGKPTISGDNGGITDIMSSRYYYTVPSSLQKATESPHIPWYTANMNWKVLDEDKLSETMLDIYNNREKTAEITKKARKYVVDNFSFQQVGQLMKTRLEEISKEL